MQTRRLPALVALVALAALLAWVILRPPASPPPAEAGAEPSATAALPPRHALSWRPGARTAVPRSNKAPASAPTATSAPQPTPTPAAPSAPPPGSAREAPEEAAASGPIDRREHPPADAARTMTEVQARLSDAEADIGACLEAWRQEDPNLEGTVNMGFQIDASGLQQAFVVDHEGVPLGPLTCFSAAIADIDWSGVSSEPVEISFPFDVAPAP